MGRFPGSAEVAASTPAGERETHPYRTVGAGRSTADEPARLEGARAAADERRPGAAAVRHREGGVCCLAGGHANHREAGLEVTGRDGHGERRRVYHDVAGQLDARVGERRELDLRELVVRRARGSGRSSVGGPGLAATGGGCGLAACAAPDWLSPGPGQRSAADRARAARRAPGRDAAWRTSWGLPGPGRRGGGHGGAAFAERGLT